MFKQALTIVIAAGSNQLVFDKALRIFVKRQFYSGAIEAPQGLEDQPNEVIVIASEIDAERTKKVLMNPSRLTRFSSTTFQPRFKQPLTYGQPLRSVRMAIGMPRVMHCLGALKAARFA